MCWGVRGLRKVRVNMGKCWERCGKGEERCVRKCLGVG